MTVKTVQPSASYHLQVPAEAEEQDDDSSSSFWIEGEPLLLQLSSYRRESGDQVPARERLASRMKKHAGDWRPVVTRLCADPRCDEASAELRDENGVTWLHGYFVWPHLAIYATVSGPQSQVRDVNSWALQALKSIEFSENGLPGAGRVI